MAQFVRKGHYIARLAQVVKHHIGVYVGDRGVCECSRSFTRFHASVDPAIREEGFGNFSHARVKGAICIHHGLFCLFPADYAGIIHWQRRVPVPNLHLVEPEPLAFQLIVPVAQLGVRIDDRVAQRLNHFRLHVIAQVPAGLCCRHAAPTVDDLFFLGLCVVDTCENFDVVRKNLCQFMAGRLAFAALRVGQKVQSALDI